MKKEHIGNACAHCLPPGAEKAKYPRIGSAFRSEDGQISLKIDSLPIPAENWTGWINVFPPREGSSDSEFKSNTPDTAPKRKEGIVSKGKQPF